MPEFVVPQLATLVDAAPTDPAWVFEIKYDGYRLEALIDRGTVRLLTRRGNDWTNRFATLALRLAKLPVKSATLDGEVVALDPSGKSTFSLLQQSIDAARSQDLVYFVFDLLSLDGEDLRSLPLAERRRRLERLLRTARATGRGLVRLGQRLDGAGPVLLRAACRLGLEGIIGKRNDAPYVSTRGPAWVKVKCGHRQEFVAVGWTPPQGSRTGIGSLLLAVHDQGHWRYAGRVGSGIPDEMLRNLSSRLRTLARRESPFAARPAGIPGTVRWVEPRLVVEVSFTEWTPDGRLRHPVFQGVREDKPPSEVRREEPRMSQPRTRGANRASDPGKAKAPRRTAKSAPSSGPVVVAGVTITHPDRVVYPETGITKADLARHFERVAPLMLPHAGGRPLALVRCPEGIAKQCFFQKHWPSDPPASIDTVPIRQSDGVRPHVVIHDVVGLVTLVQWGVMEIHAWGSRADNPELPDRIIFDLDPDPAVGWPAVTEAAAGLHALLDALGLASWLKTSGGKGLHVVVPVARRSNWDEVSDFARRVATHLEAEFPDRFIAKASKKARQGRIFVDWLRNTRGATAIVPWSARARAAAGVSVPIPWSQLGTIKSGEQFTLASIAEGRPPRTDPWREMLASKQPLTRSIIAKLR
ncbi:MAG: DNA ligase D [Gemmatimonadales bacterium]